MNQRFFKAKACLIALLAVLFLSATAFGQGAGASLTGTITDSTDAVIPGAVVIAANVDTGVTTRVTANNSGVYNFASLQTGNYTVAVEAPGFTRATRTDVRLTVGSQIRLNIDLAVAGTVTEVQVSGSVESMALEAGASSGILMQEQMIQAVPLLSGNLIDLIGIMSGVSTDNQGSSGSASMAGVGGYNKVNVVRDGISITEVRNTESGIAANSNINTEMIAEFRMILAPVDAEMGRGAGQVQMTTRSGSNEFHGSAVWNVQNTALDAMDFSLKQNQTPRNWRNLNNYMLTASGPIIRNKTFFFVTWEQQFARDRLLTDLKVMTNCARKGIYRYLGGTVPAGYSPLEQYNGNTMAVPSVDADGFPLKSGMFQNVNQPDQFYTIDPVQNALHIESIFGDFTDDARNDLLAYTGKDGVWGDCSGITFTPQATTTAWSNNTSGFYSSSITPGNLLKPNSYWGEGVYRSAYDPTGFVGRFLKGSYSEMPPATSFETGDGLNYASYRWHAPFVGTGASIFGTGGDPDRKSITVKIDHNINNDHRVSGTFSKETFYTNDMFGLTSPGQWPAEYGGYLGRIDRKPWNLLMSLTSTLRPTLLNEARFGLTRSETWTYDPITANAGLVDVMTDLMNPSYTQNVLSIVGAGEGAFMYHTDPNDYFNLPSHPIGGRGMVSTSWGGSDPRWTLSDTVTWMKGTHSFKGGVEYRRQSSTQEYNGVRAFQGAGGMSGIPAVWGGLTTETSNRRMNAAALGAATSDVSSNAWKDVASPSYDNAFGSAGNYTTPYQMMTYFSGSVLQSRQYFYFMPDNTRTTGARWNNTLDGENHFAYTLRSQEFAFFFKDDWKVTPSLTLNLGVRYEYYGVPHTDGGRTIRMADGGFAGAFGITKGGWDNWMNNRQLVQSPYDPYVSGTDYMPNFPAIGELGSSGYTLVGPESRNPDVMAWNRDVNNIGPHIGFSWSLPWFGKGLTTLRGGWSISHLPIDNFNYFGVYIAQVTAANTDRVETFNGTGSGGGIVGNANDSTAYYMDMTNLSRPGTGQLLGNNGYLFEPTRQPFDNYRVGEMRSAAYVMDENITSPYVHSFNMALTRQVGRALTVDLRYVGTMSQNFVVGATTANAMNINQVRYINNVSPNGYDLLTEMEKVRVGNYQSPLLNSLIPAGSLGSFSLGPESGSDQLINGYVTSADMATGQYASVASTLAGLSYIFPNGTLTPPEAGVAGMIFRGGCLPEDRSDYLAAYASNPNVNAYDFQCTQGTPWNYYVVNPQYGSINFLHNAGTTNYHSMQAQVTMRPTRGLSFQASYTWSRTLSDGGYSNYLEDHITGRDYLLTGTHRTHVLNTFGTYELPLGPNGFLLRDASGFLKKAVEGWQLSWVTQMSSGVPTSVTGTSGQWANTRPDIVRPDLWDNKVGGVETFWNADGTYREGLYFGSRYVKVLDRNICDPTKMTETLYTTNCEYLSPSGKMELRSGAPRALALNSGTYDGFGDPIPMSYSNAQEGVAMGDQLAMTYYDPNIGRDLTPVIVFRNHYQGDGTQGNFAQNQLTGQGRFTFDLAMSKAIEFMEGKRFEIRVDAQNILNHPTATNGTNASYGGRVQSISGPNLSISNATTFGRMSTKGSHRTFQARLRLSF